MSFSSLETLCVKSIPNGNLSDTCGTNVGDTCDNFTCDYGFKEAENVVHFNCTESGTWEYNLSALCIGMDSTLFSLQY